MNINHNKQNEAQAWQHHSHNVESQRWKANIKGGKWKMTHYIQRRAIWLIANFSSKCMKHKTSYCVKKMCEHILLYPEKLYFKDEGLLSTVSDKEKQGN